MSSPKEYTSTKDLIEEQLRGATTVVGYRQQSDGSYLPINIKAITDSDVTWEYMDSKEDHTQRHGAFLSQIKLLRR